MVKLLECQENLAYNKEELEVFAIALICSLLDIFEIDLSVTERLEIERFCSAWQKE